MSEADRYLFGILIATLVISTAWKEKKWTEILILIVTWVSFIYMMLAH